MPTPAPKVVILSVNQPLKPYLKPQRQSASAFLTAAGIAAVFCGDGLRRSARFRIVSIWCAFR